ALLEEDGGLLLRRRGQPEDGVVELEGAHVVLLRHQEPAGPLEGRQVLGRELARLLVVREGPVRVAERQLRQARDLEVQARPPAVVSLADELRLGQRDQLLGLRDEGGRLLELELLDDAGRQLFCLGGLRAALRQGRRRGGPRGRRGRRHGARAGRLVGRGQGGQRRALRGRRDLRRADPRRGRDRRRGPARFRGRGQRVPAGRGLPG